MIFSSHDTPILLVQVHGRPISHLDRPSSLPSCFFEFMISLTRQLSLLSRSEGDGVVAAVPENKQSEDLKYWLKIVLVLAIDGGINHRTN